MGLSHLLILSILFDYTTCENTDISHYNSIEHENTLILLREINGGCKIVYDYCESIQYNQGYVFKESKPDCSFNYSYINNNGTVYLFQIDDDVRNMIKDYKKDVCNTENIQCGEYTIIIKIIDIINSAISIINKDVYNVNIWNNLDVIDFHPDLVFLKKAINNVELLTNITLKKRKINLLLQAEKQRIDSEYIQIGIKKYINNVYNYIGKPIESAGGYIGYFVGNTLGEVLENVLPEVKSDTKIIIIIILVILLKRL